LNCIENYDKKRYEKENVRVTERKAYKSQYHNNKELPKERASYENISVKEV